MAVLLVPTMLSGKDIDRPDQPGRYDVGFTTFTAVMTGGRMTQVRVFYPTLDASDHPTEYTIRAAVGSGTYQLASPLWALQDAQPLPGQFPLVVYDHGGNPAGTDFQSVSEVNVQELMASHGIVSAVALHSADAIIRVRDLPLVIDVMLARSADDGDPLFDSVDPDRIGVWGFSAGGAAAVGATGGVAASGIAADPRIKALVLYEPGRLGSFAMTDAANIAVPYLIMGGTQSIGAAPVATLFDTTVLARPRVRVLNPGAAHFSYVANMGAEIDQTREQALLADPSIPEPLTTLTASNTAAARAYQLWNQGEILFTQLGVGAGSGRNICNRVGVNSLRSLDVNHDGFTDSPPFQATDAFLLQPTIPHEAMAPMIKLYTVAFWKVYLEGDGRYDRYLTPAYAKQNKLEAKVFRVE
jgi:predicted dienelactone hydrolase